MSYLSAVDHLYALGHELAPTLSPTGTPAPRRKFDLAHMRALMAALGDPQTSFPSVLIAGTNGKGSTASTLASILTAAGYRTALYTSPHLIRVNERIQIDGIQIPDEDFARLYFQVDDAANRLVFEGTLPHHPSFFEVLTALAFLYFAGHTTDRVPHPSQPHREGWDSDTSPDRVPHSSQSHRDGWGAAPSPVDIAILEVGLGGRLDATNIVEPLISIITDIALDHQDYLGNTIAAITREKAGIIRPNGILVTLPQHPEANQAIGEAAATLNLTAISAAPYIPPPTKVGDTPQTRVPHLRDSSIVAKVGGDATEMSGTENIRPLDQTQAATSNNARPLDQSEAGIGNNARRLDQSEAERRDPCISSEAPQSPTQTIPEPKQTVPEPSQTAPEPRISMGLQPHESNTSSEGALAPGAPTLSPNRYTLTLDNQTLEVDSPLHGQHQQRNIALAIAAAIALRNQTSYKSNTTSNQTSYKITNANIEAGIRNTRWPGRLELIPGHPPLLLDVAHNPAGAWTLRAAIAELPSAQPRTLIFSCLRDKSLKEMSQILLPLFDSTSGDPDRAHDHIILAPIDNPRAASLTDLLAAAHAMDIPAHAAPHIPAALAEARAKTPADGIIIATGSIYLVGEIRNLALHQEANPA